MQTGHKRMAVSKRCTPRSPGRPERRPMPCARGCGAIRGARRPPRAGRSEALALDPLALELAGAANRLSRLTSAALGRLLVVPAQLHLAKDPLALHLLLERLQRLIDIVIPNKNLHLAACS